MGRRQGHPNDTRTYLDGGVFNKVEFLGTDAMGGGHGDMRNAGGLHAKIMRNQKVKAPTQGAKMAFEDFVRQDQAAHIAASEAAKRPDAKKVKQMVGPGKLAPMIDTGGGRKARMVVGVRVRPLSSKEARKGNTDVLEVKNGQECYAYDPDDKMGGLDYLRLNVSKDKAYTFDHAFGPESTSEDVYNKTMKGVVSAVMQGFHGSCFAYGATGSGKTFTMAGTQESPGVMPRAISDLFKIARSADEMSWKFSLTYVEIYNERIKDLLNPGRADLDVRECPKRGNVVAGAVEVGVTSLQEIMELMSKGTLYRTTEATNCNEVSSRSHAVLQISCVGVEKYKEQRGAKKQAARLSMIDLAGSERAYKTDNTGQRLREGRNINRSLLSLANCINALADKSKKISHVPYRDSKLTRLLRDSLSGTSVSAMICAVSPSSDQFEETLNTLKYANRAKQMSPPSVPQRNQRDYHPVDEKVEVLKELKDSLLPIMKQISTPKQAAGGKKGKQADKHADKENAHGNRNAREERAERRNRQRDGLAPQQANGKKAPAAADESDEDIEEIVCDPAPNRRLSAAVEEAASAATSLTDTSNMAEVRKALEEVCEAEPEARSNPAVAAAYVALDGMEAEEVEAISAESALLYKEQQNLVREIARSKHALKLSAVRLAWYDAAPEHMPEDEVPGDENVGGGKEGLEELQSRMTDEEDVLQRLRRELTENKSAVAGLQAEVPERIVSSKRLSQLKLVMRHQQAATDSLRFKQQARSAAGLMEEVLQSWQTVIPEELSNILLEVFDLPDAAKGGASIDTQRRAALESARSPGADGGGTPATGKAMAKGATRGTKAKTPKSLPAEVIDSPRDEHDDDEEDEDEEDEPHVLDSGGVATPWRTLGSLAQKATRNTADDDDEDDDDDEEADENEEEEGELATEVVRKAHEELKDARTRRLSVMKFVEEAATPKPKKRTRPMSALAGGGSAAAPVALGRRVSDAGNRPKQPAIDESQISLNLPSLRGSSTTSPETASLPSSPRVGGRRNTRAAARPPVSDRSSDRPARKARARASSNPKERTAGERRGSGRARPIRA